MCQTISLINSDAKMLGKVLACRLERCRPILIDPDQNWLIKQFQAIRCVFLVLDNIHAKSDHPDTVLLCLDGSQQWSYQKINTET